MTRVMRARLGFFAGLLLVGAGVTLAIGLGWALVVTGVGTAAAFVWLYDVTEPEKPQRLSRLPLHIRGEYDEL